MRKKRFNEYKLSRFLNKLRAADLFQVYVESSLSVQPFIITGRPWGMEASGIRKLKGLEAKIKDLNRCMPA